MDLTETIRKVNLNRSFKFSDILTNVFSSNMYSDEPGFCDDSARNKQVQH